MESALPGQNRRSGGLNGQAIVRFSSQQRSLGQFLSRVLFITVQKIQIALKICWVMVAALSMSQCLLPQISQCLGKPKHYQRSRSLPTMQAALSPLPTTSASKLAFYGVGSVEYGVVAV